MDAQLFVKINVTVEEGLSPDEDGRRAWLASITWITRDEAGRTHSENSVVEITDPFTIGEYHDYEERRHHQSQSAYLHPDPDAEFTDACSTHAATSDYRQNSPSSSKLDEYRQQLHEMLELNKVLRSPCLVKINIMEELHIPDQESPDRYSIHSLLWELLEHHPSADIQVTRWITSKDPARSLPAGLCKPDKPIHILLIIARDLKYVDGGHVDLESVAYDTLYSMLRFLKFRGRHGRLSLEVVRPGTFSEFQKHLGRRRHYDLVHIDMHGVVKRLPEPTLDYSPNLCFGHCITRSPASSPAIEGAQEDEESYDMREAEEVAKLLEGHGIKVVVLSACVSSYGQGRLLSNMCRVFAGFGICAVTGMNFSVKAATAQTYYRGFYEALILSNQSFRNAAVHGRRNLFRRPPRTEETTAREQEEGSTQAGSQTPGTASALHERAEDSQQSYTFDEWPTVTTYFAMGDKFNRTNSIDIMGERPRLIQHWPFRYTPAEIIDLILLLMMTSAGIIIGVVGEVFSGDPLQMVMGTLIVALIYLIMSKVRASKLAFSDNGADISKAFKSFQDELEESQLKHSVGLMVLENGLRSLRKLFINIRLERTWEEQHRQFTQDLCNQWRMTNFADRVEVVPASTFMYPLKDWYRKAQFIMSHWYTGWRRRSKDPGLQSTTTVLIITEMDSVIDHDKPKSQAALDRISSYIQSVEKRSTGGFYLMFTGHGGVEWPEMDVNRERHGWSEAEPFIGESGFTTVRRDVPVEI